MEMKVSENPKLDNEMIEQLYIDLIRKTETPFDTLSVLAMLIGNIYTDAGSFKEDVFEYHLIIDGVAIKVTISMDMDIKLPMTEDLGKGMKES